MLVYLKVVVVMIESGFERSLRLGEVTGLFVENTYLEKGVDLPLHGEGVREN